MRDMGPRRIKLPIWLATFESEKRVERAKALKIIAKP
jgi:hypothetical protein